MDNPVKNVQYLNSLRAISIVSVIIIHVSSPLVNMNWGGNTEFWWIGNMFDSAVRFAVPMFLMLTGATLLGREYNLKEFYIRRFSRVLLPFLFWMMIYWCYRWSVLSPNIQPHDFRSVINWAINLFLRIGISKHFWYVYMIVFIYLFVPLLSKSIMKLNLQTISSILLIWAIIAFELKSTPMNMYCWSNDYGSKFLAYFLSMGYLLLGYYLYKLPINVPRLKLIAGVIFFITILVCAISTYFISKNSNSQNLSMYSYLSVNSMIQSIAVFLMLKEVEVQNKFINNLLNKISNSSYGIYLSHIMIIDFFFDHGIFWTMTHPILSVPLIVILVLITSYVVINILKLIPGAKYISG